MKLYLITILILYVSTAWAGNFVNNGIDQIDEKDDAAWFVGARDIHGCVEVADGFGVDITEATKTIRRAFSLWENYFEKKGLKQDLRKAGLEFSTSISLHQGCEGNEDIAFYLGVKDNFLLKAALGFRRPLALAQRISYDEASRWGKGFVWVAAPSDFADEKLDWSRDNHLLGALLHEIGHVYGCGHVGSTIMRADLSETILQPKDDFLHVMTQIDSGKQLYFCELCGGEFRATIVHEDVIGSLIGRQLIGKLRARLSLENDASRLPYGTIEIQDEKMLWHLKLTARSVLADAFSDTLLFHVPASLDKSQKETFATRHAGKVFLATLSYGGKSLNLVYKRNMEVIDDITTPFADQLVLFDPDIANNNLMFLFPKK